MTVTMPVRDQFTEADGLKVRYIEDGDGPPAIMLHGASLGSSADVFQRNLPPLAAHGVRAIAFDQPGFGRTDAPADHTVSYRTRFILDFMDAIGLEKASVVGHSQAGGMAASLAFSHPDRIEKIVVLGSGSLLPPLPDNKPAGGPAEGREGTPTEPTIEDTRKLLEANLFHTELITEEELQLRHSHSLGKNFEAFVARGQAREPKPKDEVPLWKRLDTCPVPLLLIYGREDRGQAAKRVEILRKEKPMLDIHVIDGCKHLVPWDAAEAWVRLAGPFLSK